MFTFDSKEEMSFNLEDFGGKTILVLGGGTSTLDRKWENLDYDYLWTCNSFYMEERLLKKKVDLFMLGFLTDIESKVLRSKLRDDTPFTFFEESYYRGKQNWTVFRDFVHAIGYPVYNMPIPFDHKYTEAQKAGAAFRLVVLAMMSNASKIYFAGLDGFNESFSNVHAFTKHPGLKDSDTRRKWKEEYYPIFSEAYLYLAGMEGLDRLQNLGEGLDYNIGTPISKKYFPLKKEVYERIK